MPPFIRLGSGGEGGEPLRSGRNLVRSRLKEENKLVQTGGILKNTGIYQVTTK